MSLTKPIALLGLMGVAAFVSISTMAAHHFAFGSSEPDIPYSIGDIFVFASEKPGYTTFILTANPSLPPGKGGGEKANLTPKTAFPRGGLFNIHIATDKEFEQGMTLTVSFDGLDVSIVQINNPNATIGEIGRLIGEAKVEKSTVLNNGMKFWAGRSLEPLYINAYDFGVFQSGINAGKLDDNAYRTTGKDIFENARISSIVFDVPNELIKKEKMYVFATTARQDPKHGNEWIQVNRMAYPLTSYITFFNTPTLQYQHDQTRPDTDKDRKMAISTNIFRAVTAAGVQTDPSAYSNKTADKMTPDVLTYTIGDRSGFSFGGTGGRALTDDVADIVFSAYVGKPFSDFIVDPVRYQQPFPYVIPVNQP
ncbi:MAG: hypothetical protein AAF387_10495 [Pseudomonadota bacterium]